MSGSNDGRAPAAGDGEQDSPDLRVRAFGLHKPWWASDEPEAEPGQETAPAPPETDETDDLDRPAAGTRPGATGPGGEPGGEALPGATGPGGEPGEEALPDAFATDDAEGGSGKAALRDRPGAAQDAFSREAGRPDAAEDASGGKTGRPDAADDASGRKTGRPGAGGEPGSAPSDRLVARGAVPRPTPPGDDEPDAADDSAAPVLQPDAIIPPGITPPASGTLPLPEAAAKPPTAFGGAARSRPAPLPPEDLVPDERESPRGTGSPGGRPFDADDTAVDGPPISTDDLASSNADASSPGNGLVDAGGPASTSPPNDLPPGERPGAGGLPANSPPKGAPLTGAGNPPANGLPPGAAGTSALAPGSAGDRPDGFPPGSVGNHPGALPPGSAGDRPGVFPPGSVGDRPGALPPGGAGGRPPGDAGDLLPGGFAPDGGERDATAPQPAVVGGAQPPFGPGPMAQGAGAPARGGNKRRATLFAAGGVAAVIVLGAAGYALAGGGDGAPERAASAKPASPAASPSVSGQPPITPTAPTAPSGIDTEKTDPRPLALIEVFPANAVTLGGHAYVRDRSSVNHDCSLTARGAMAAALAHEKCRGVVRATFIDRERTVAVTTGVAILPTKAAALRAGRAGDPSRYEWFRGMQGKRSTEIDRAGGYAAATVRGRYIIYAYAQYAKGRPAPGGPNLKTVTRQFIDYAVRPIEARA
ncbi:hypothetical protein [Actinomadura atramentaria]|uniref:hypothetical protein n=1 Tax=Actinomadura atramentaria TaxID=1990 RepID=UPI00039E9E91|nr:hypothetical protein [Actinomadura atramentaria]